ncbi:3-dehydrosphinganine reductase TSC10A-like protein [Drosera capensis]
MRRRRKSAVVVFSANVRDFDAVMTAIEAAGPVETLVCNHSVFFPQELDEKGIHEIKLTVDVNLMGTFHLIKAALPSMKQNGKDRGPASIAIMSSMAGQMGVYGYAAYSALKFGLRGLAEALQQEVVEDDIHVSLICLSPTDTPGLTGGQLYPRLPGQAALCIEALLGTHKLPRKKFAPKIVL